METDSGSSNGNGSNGNSSNGNGSKGYGFNSYDKKQLLLEKQEELIPELLGNHPAYWWEEI